MAAEQFHQNAEQQICWNFFGVNIETLPQIAKKALEEVGICFLYAPLYHSAAKYVKEVRATIKLKTIFNLLGPLLNPLQTDYQLIGVYDSSICHSLAQVLNKCGTKRALVIHGEGLDEFAIHGTTTGVKLMNGEISEFILTPEDVGLKRYPLSSLKGGDVKHNAHQFIQLLKGNGADAYRASVALNAGALLWLVDKASSIKEGSDLIQAILSTDLGLKKLEHLIQVSHAK